MILPLAASRIRLVDKPTQIGSKGQTIVVRPGTVVVDTNLIGALVCFPRALFEAAFPQAEFDKNTREYTLPELPKPRKRKTVKLDPEKTDDSGKET